MNPPPSQFQPDSIDTTTLGVIVQSTMDTLPHHPGASAEEQAADRHTAYTIIATLRPRDVLEAMLAARIAALQFHIMDDLRSAAAHDLPQALKVRHRRSAAALAKMQEAAERDLFRRQAYPAQRPVALPVAVPAARPQPAPAVAPSEPAPRPEAAARQRPAAPRPATGGFVLPSAAEINRLAAETQAIFEAATRPDDGMLERLEAEVAARAAASATPLAA